MIKKSLIVLALEAESQGKIEKLDAPIDILYTGVGKVNAAIALGQALRHQNYQQIINVGSAGSHLFEPLQVVCCHRFLQHDMNAQVFGYAPFQTPQEKNIALTVKVPKSLQHLPQTTLYTGDQFISDPNLGYPVIDMEGYALAKTTQKYEIPFICLKFISDNANQKASYTWEESLMIGSELLTNILNEFLKN